MSSVYILINKDNKIYIGSSRKDDPSERLLAHNSGKTKSTKSGRPWGILFFEKFENYTLARKRELFLKSGQGRKYIKERCQSG
jgi:putative endonuclease